MGISTVTISMKNWTREMLSEYGGSDVRKSPATGDVFNQKGSEELNAEKKRKFHKFTAKLLYLAKRIKADILTAISVLCTRVKESTVEILGHVGLEPGTLRLENISESRYIFTHPMEQILAVQMTRVCFVMCTA
jgi:hypothetical protein